MTEQTLRVHDSLADALAEVNGRVPEGLRPYVCRTSSGDRFVISNSPGQAAIAVCEVRACTRQEAMDAILELYDRQRQGQSRMSSGTCGTKPKRSGVAPDTASLDTH